jgi:mannose-6-phosphate isomerase-like protein (cupin superfamily)
MPIDQGSLGFSDRRFSTAKTAGDDVTARIASPAGCRPTITPANAWIPDPTVFAGSWEGAEHGATTSIIANDIQTVGDGVAFHQHPYAEVFVVRSGHAVFTVGDATMYASAGQIVVAPADVPHAFVNRGPGPLQMLDIHEHATFTTRWIDTAL